MVQSKPFLKPLISARIDLLKAVLVPFLGTRLIWELVAFFSAGSFQPNPTYEAFAKRGYFLTRVFAIDIFARWDSHHYFSILKNGYSASSDLGSVYSNMAFFPLYPMLVKSFGWLGLHLTDGFYLLLGVILSNLFFLAAVFLLYHLSVRNLGFSEEATRRGILLLFVFPTSFYFSSFYPESLFLVLIVAGFMFGLRDQWLPAGIISALAVITRAQGVLLFLSLMWLYMEKREWKFKTINKSVLWFLLPPLTLATHMYYLFLKSGRLFAFFDAQAAWGKSLVNPISGIWENISGPTLDVFKMDFLFGLFFLLMSVFILKKHKYKALGFFGILMCLMPFSTGSVVSFSRYVLPIFPVFLGLGERIEDKDTFFLVTAILFALQIIYFSGWVNYYWIA